MQTARIQALGYLLVGATDLDAWAQYAREILGVAAIADGDALLLRYDDEIWRIKVTPTGEDDVVAVGFSVADNTTLDAILARLDAQGIDVAEADDATRRDRRVDRLVVCTDPDGLRIELFVGDRTAAVPPTLPRDTSGFVAGDQGLGHIVLYASDSEKSEAFYRDGLGFLLSDHIVLGPPGRAFTITFLHCNPRHHTLALAPMKAPKRLNHIMLQVGSLDEVGKALDLANGAGIRITSSLGKHTNDHMTSFYMQTPSGFDIEYGYGGIEIDDAVWQPVSYDATSIWGHKSA